MKMVEHNRREALQRFIQLEIPEQAHSIDVRLIPKMKPGIGHYLMEVAEEVNADLIVIGARGHSRVERLLIGSVTEKVLAMTTRIPVFVIK
jgi:nucleotide-binding universal stress UspA family protein